jgi:hypothetical protein
MKLFLWILLGLGVALLAFVMVISSSMDPQRPWFLILAVFVFAVPPFGAYWMLYMAIRYERKPLPMILLAFLPYSFLWYYFERVRPGKHLTRTDAPQGEGRPGALHEP